MVFRLLPAIRSFQLADTSTGGSSPVERRKREAEDHDEEEDNENRRKRQRATTEFISATYSYQGQRVWIHFTNDCVWPERQAQMHP